MALIEKHTLRFIEGIHYEEFEFCAHCLSLADTVHWINRSLYFYKDGPRNSIAILHDRHIDIFQVYRAAMTHFANAGLWYCVEHLFYARYLVILMNIRQDSILPLQSAALFNRYEAEFCAVVNDMPKLILYSLLDFFEKSGLGRRNLILGIRTDTQKTVYRKSLRASSPGKIKTTIRSLLLKVSPTYKAVHQTRELVYALHRQVEELMRDHNTD
jgi:hypothetical protein